MRFHVCKVFKAWCLLPCSSNHMSQVSCCYRFMFYLKLCASKLNIELVRSANIVTTVELKDKSFICEVWVLVTANVLFALLAVFRLRSSSKDSSASIKISHSSKNIFETFLCRSGSVLTFCKKSIQIMYMVLPCGPRVFPVFVSETENCDICRTLPYFYINPYVINFLK